MTEYAVEVVRPVTVDRDVTVLVYEEVPVLVEDPTLIPVLVTVVPRPVLVVVKVFVLNKTVRKVEPEVVSLV